jgi:hypothetical protein
MTLLMLLVVSISNTSTLLYDHHHSIPSQRTVFLRMQRLPENPCRVIVVEDALLPVCFI